MTSEKQLEPVLWLISARGIYLPRDFVNRFSEPEQHISGIEADTLDILRSGPDHKDYWEAWTEVCDRAVVTDLQGNRFRVYQQEGDCWLIPEQMEWSDEADWFVWPEEGR